MPFTVLYIKNSDFFPFSRSIFRPEFDRIGDLRANLKAPFIGLSATLPPSMLKKLPEKLRFKPGYKVFARSPDNPNIFLDVRQKPSNYDAAACR